MEPDRTLKKTEDLGLLAVVRGESRSAALEVVGALVEGGVLGIEITFTTPDAPQVIRDLDEEYGDDILLGAGTGEGAELELGEPLLGLRLLGRDGAQPAEEEAQRDRDDAGVLQREPVEVHVGREQ